MSQFARIESVDALRRLRVFLCAFGETVSAGVAEAEADIRRTRLWLEREQAFHWKDQIRKRGELLRRAKAVLSQKQMLQQADRSSHALVEERRAVAVAQKRLAEAEQKAANVKHWTRQLERDASTHKGAMQQIARAAEVDLPRSIARLDGMIRALESYMALAPPTSEVDIASAWEAMAWAEDVDTETVSLGADERIDAWRPLRDRTPSAEARRTADVGAVAAEPFGDAMDEGHVALLAAMAMGDATVDPEATAVVADGVWGETHVYFERVGVCTESDSGWFIGPAEQRAVKGLVTVRLAELLAVRPDLANILALPEHYLVVIRGGSVEGILDSKDRCVYPIGDRVADSNAS